MCTYRVQILSMPQCNMFSRTPIIKIRASEVYNLQGMCKECVYTCDIFIYINFVAMRWEKAAVALAGRQAEILWICLYYIGRMCVWLNFDTLLCKCYDKFEWYEANVTAINEKVSDASNNNNNDDRRRRRQRDEEYISFFTALTAWQLYARFHIFLNSLLTLAKLCMSSNSIGNEQKREQNHTHTHIHWLKDKIILYTHKMSFY